MAQTHIEFRFSSHGTKRERSRVRVALERALVPLRAAARSGAYEDEACSLALPDDRAHLAAVRALVRRHRRPGLRYVIVIGIGGSTLGTRAVDETLRGLSTPRSAAELVFVETVEPRQTETVRKLLAKTLRHPDEAAVCIVSKSGVTTETVANAAVLVDAYERRWPGRPHHLIAVTDDGSPLWRLAHGRGWRTVPIPSRVGGRFSVLSGVGLVPLGLAGYDIAALLQGAREMRDACLKVAGPAAQQAAMLQGAGRGRHVHVLFPFRPQLETMAKWLRQIEAESLGKRGSAAAYPAVAVGTTDLHATGQFFFGNPDRVTMTFVSAPDASVRVPRHPLADLVPGLAGATIGGLQQTVEASVERDARQRGIPVSSVRLPHVDERIVGQLLQWQMMTVMLLGHLLRVNAFDQPDVEGYKALVRKRLQR